MNLKQEIQIKNCKFYDITKTSKLLEFFNSFDNLLKIRHKIFKSIIMNEWKIRFSFRIF